MNRFVQRLQKRMQNEEFAAGYWEMDTELERHVLPDMSIEEHSIEAPITAPAGQSQTAPPQANTQQPPQSWRTFLRSPLWICLLLALIIRVWLVIHTHGIIDGDEALLGIQAEHILRGELPIYFYGQPYLGSLEAYLVAILFAIAGPSVWTLRAEPILLSLLLVWLTWKLAAALADHAQLPAYAKRTFITIAGLFAAIPPLYDGVIELRTFGGFIEIFILILLLLLSSLQLTRRWQAGATPRELALRWASIGFIIGLGFWIYPLIISAVLASAIWILCQGWIILRGLMTINKPPVGASAKLAERVSIPSRPSPIYRPFGSPPVRQLSDFLLPTLAAIPASLIGFAPALYWGATHQWQNITYVLGLGSGTSIDRLDTIHKVTRLYLTCVAPRVISGAVPKENALLSTLHTPLLIIGTLCIFALIALVALSFLSPHPSFLRIRQLVALPLLFAACTTFIFCVSTVSASGLLSTCDADFAGRYATPLLLTLPFLLATIFTLATIYIHERNNPVGASAKLAERVSIPSRPSPIYRPRGGVRHLLQTILFALLLAYLGTQAWTYNLTDPAATFQSPFCLEAPANNDPIIAYMQQEHIHYAWAANLLAYPIVFKTNGSIIIANPLALTTPPLAINRIPAYTATVQHADRPSILIFAQHNDPHPALLTMLDNQQITYQVARFPSELGIDVLVITPLNRTISPFESNAFNSFFICGP